MNNELFNPQNTELRTLVDANQDVFRYGLNKFDDSKYEDPTYLGFTIEIDDKSALFNDVLPFLEKHSDKTEMSARISVYKEFIAKVRQIFNSQESIKDESDKSKFIKQHYINSVSGLNLLTKKFVEWREDKLSVELFEDIAMFSTYLTHLYNNLIYSYENGRMMIPENLLKFNLYIKISEIRNLTSIAKLNSREISQQQIAQSLKSNITCLVYKLYDCEFDFFASQPIPESIIQSGIDSSAPSHAVLSLDIYFKSVSRQVYNPLVSNALSMNDNKVDLDVKIISTSGQASTTGQSPNPSASTTTSDGQPTQKQQVNTVSIYNQEAFMTQNQKKASSNSTYETEKKNGGVTEQRDLTEKEKQIEEIKKSNKPLNPFKAVDPAQTVNDEEQTFLQSLGQQAKQAGRNVVETSQKVIKRRIETLALQKRNELIRTFLNRVKQTATLNKQINPDNVYTDANYFKNALAQIGGDIGQSVSGELTDLLKNTIINKLNKNNKLGGLGNI
jgi:hypothetical protein